MRKILFALFLILGLSFPQSDVFAQGTPQRTVPICTTEIVDPKPVSRTDRKPPTCTNPSAVCYKVFSVNFADCYKLAESPTAPGTAPGGAVECKKLLSCIPGDGLSPNSNNCLSSADGTPYAAKVALDTANICPVGQVPSSNDVNTCRCGVSAAAAAAVACTDPATCSSGKGTRCDLATGQPLDPGARANPNSGIYTAIGCVPTQPQALVEGLIRYGTMGAAGIAFLLMILGALQMITSEGNPESIKHAQERFYSAIIGLLLIVFSVLLMQVIGVDVLDLPGFAP